MGLAACFLDAWFRCSRVSAESGKSIALAPSRALVLPLATLPRKVLRSKSQEGVRKAAYCKMRGERYRPIDLENPLGVRKLRQGIVKQLLTTWVEFENLRPEQRLYRGMRLRKDARRYFDHTIFDKSLEFGKNHSL